MKDPAFLTEPLAAAAPETFPCAQCGAELRYDSGAEGLACGYCGHEAAINLEGAEPLAELDYRRALANDIAASEVETTQVVHCDSCGANVEFDPDEHAAACPFCAAALVTDTGAHRHFKPKGVLPFALPESDAKAALARWLASRWFAPSALKRYARADKRLAGIYLPFWTFDADTKSDYEGERGDAYYVRKTVGSGSNRRTQQVRKIRWRPARGRVFRAFDDVLVCASRSLPEGQIERIDQWDLYALSPYRREYLAGFRAEAYVVDLAEGFEAAKEIMARTIRQDVRADIGGDRQRVHALSTRYDAVTFKHVLLPVWVAAYRYRGKAYRCLINARTGRMTGERPYSWWKIGAALAAALIVAGGLAYAYMTYAQ